MNFELSWNTIVFFHLSFCRSPGRKQDLQSMIFSIIVDNSNVFHLYNGVYISIWDLNLQTPVHRRYEFRLWNDDHWWEACPWCPVYTMTVRPVGTISSHFSLFLIEQQQKKLLVHHSDSLGRWMRPILGFSFSTYFRESHCISNWITILQRLTSKKK